MKTSLEIINNDRGFVLLFAVTLSTLLLAVAIGVANIVTQELNFGSSAKESNDAFFAADSGIEKVIFNDKPPSIYPSSMGTIQSQDVIITGLGNLAANCAVVNIKKDGVINPPNIITTVISKGFNMGDGACTSTNPARIEREIKLDY